MKTIKEKENFVLGRKEIEFQFEAEKTPTKIEVLDLIAKEVKKDKSLVSIKKISSSFGKHIVTVVAFVYSDLEIKKKFEEVKEEPKKEENSEKTSEPSSSGNKEEKPEEKKEEMIANPYA
jgi:ribosomal protein S24E